MTGDIVNTSSASRKAVMTSVDRMAQVRHPAACDHRSGARHCQGEPVLLRVGMVKAAAGWTVGMRTE